MTKAPSQFWQWFDTVTANAVATPLGQYMTAHGYSVAHTGGGCLAWEKPFGPDWAVWITDDEFGLGIENQEGFETAQHFACQLLHYERGDYETGPVDSTIAECIAWGETALANRQAKCQHRNDGRGNCIDCSAYLLP